jgi:ubiquinone/menaquinone biosynthesis C-methylase UbiE
MTKWTGKGETIFIRLPRIGSVVYDHLMQASPMRLYYQEIAQDLMSRIPDGCLLDVGTGPGRLLQAIHNLNPAIDLYGLDISASMVSRARKNLTGIKVDLRQGSVRKTDFPSDTFDLVTCSGSFYLWDKPEEGLQEIHRVLKRGKTACLYECNRECDREAMQSSLRENLRHLNVISKMIGPLAIRQALDAAYSAEEIRDIVRRTSFAHNFSIQEKTISRLAIWLCVELRKV